MLHASETWPMTIPSLQGSQRNDRTMIWWICNIKAEDMAAIWSNELLMWLDLDLILRGGFAGMDMWSVPVVLLSALMTFSLKESKCLECPRCQGASWQNVIAESGSSLQSTFMTDAFGDLEWELLCVQLASYLESGPTYVHDAPTPARETKTTGKERRMSKVNISYKIVLTLWLFLFTILCFCHSVAIVIFTDAREKFLFVAI